MLHVPIPYLFDASPSEAPAQTPEHVHCLPSSFTNYVRTYCTDLGMPRRAGRGGTTASRVTFTEPPRTDIPNSSTLDTDSSKRTSTHFLGHSTHSFTRFQLHRVNLCSLAVQEWFSSAAVWRIANIRTLRSQRAPRT